MEKKYVIIINGDWVVTEKMELPEAKERLRKLYDYYNQEGNLPLGERSFAAWVNDRSVIFEMIEL